MLFYAIGCAVGTEIVIDFESEWDDQRSGGLQIRKR